MSETEPEAQPAETELDEEEAAAEEEATPAAPAVEEDEPLSGHAAEAIGARLREQVEAEAAAAEAETSEPDPREGLGLFPVEASNVEATGFAVCPFCDGYGAVEPDGLLAALPAVVERISPFVQSARFARCPGCDGWGRVLTGSRLGEPGIQPCPDCNGTGYVEAGLAGQLAGLPPAGLEGANGDEAYKGPDPLRVAPPAGKSPAPGMEWNPQRGAWEYPAAV